MKFFQINTENRKSQGARSGYGNFEFIISEVPIISENHYGGVNLPPDPTGRFWNFQYRNNFGINIKEINLEIT